MLTPNLAKLKRISGELSYDTLCNMKTLAISLQGCDRHAEAYLLFKECYDKQVQTGGKNSYEALQTMLTMSTALRELNRNDEAELMLKQCLESLTKTCGENHPVTLKAIITLANVYLTAEKFQLAEEYLKKAIATQSKIMDNLHPDILVSKVSLAACYSRQDDPKKLIEAERLFKECLKHQERIFGTNHPQVKQTKTQYLILLLQTGRLEEYEALISSMGSN